MKDFIKSLFASILGCFIVLGIFFLLMFIGLASMSLSSNETYSLKDNTVLTLKLDGILQDRVEEGNPFQELIFGKSTSNLGLDDILSSIKKAKENDKIKGIYINVGTFHASNASLKEIRDELEDFKESGKFIISYANIYTQGAYYLSSVSDKVILNTKGMLDLHGLSAEPTFYKGLLDKLGIEIQIFKVGTFKSAVEPFMLDKMSDANREQVTSYLNGVWSTLLNDISDSRNISVEELNNIADEMPLLKQQDYYLSKNLVDTLMYESEVKDYLKTLMDLEDVKDVRQASINNMTTVP